MADRFYGVKVSNGIPVRSANDADLAYSAEFESPKVLIPSIGDLLLNGSGDGSSTVTHNLNYAPAALAYVKKPDGKWYPTGSTSLITKTDRIKVTVQAMGDSTISTTVKYKFWVLTDPAQDI